MNGETLKALIRRPCFWIAIVALFIMSGDESGALAFLHVNPVFIKWADRVLIGLAVWFPGVGAIMGRVPAPKLPAWLLLPLAGILACAVAGCGPYRPPVEVGVAANATINDAGAVNGLGGSIVLEVGCPQNFPPNVYVRQKQDGGVQ